MANGEPLVIEELEGDVPIVLELQDTELPNRGFTTPVEQRATVTRYPRSQIVSRQLMGVTDGPIELSGTWHDGLIFSRPGAYLTASDLKSLADQLCRRRNRCRMTYGQTIVVEGYVTKFDPGIHDDGLVPWSLTFEVDKAEPTTPAVYDPPGLPQVDDAMVAVEAERDTLRTRVGEGLAIAHIALSRAPSVLADVEARLAAGAPVDTVAVALGNLPGNTGTIIRSF